MNPFGPRLTKLTAAYFCAAAVWSVAAAPTNTVNTNLPPSKRNAPRGQSIQFSSTSGSATAPQVPTPTTRQDAVMNRPSSVNENAMPSMEGRSAPYAPSAPAPTKAFAEKMLQQMDRKKNWLMPGAQEEMLGLSNNWESKGLDSENMGLDNKNQTVMERFLNGADNKNKNRQRAAKDRSRSPSDEKEINRESRDPKSPDNDDLEKPNERDRDREREPNGVAEFSLRSALSGGLQRPDASGRKEGDSFRGFQTLPGAMMGADDNRSPRDREKEREMNASHAAEFQQMIRPRGESFSVLPDPINSSVDLTRRDMNPVLPRSEGPSAPLSNPFNAPSVAGNLRGLDSSSLFGGGGPAGMPSFSPAPNAQFSSPSAFPQPSRSIIIEPPKRKFQ